MPEGERSDEFADPGVFFRGVCVATPEWLDGVRTQRGVDGITEMADVRLVQNFHQHLESPGGADVARGDRSLHPDECAGIAGQAVENQFLVFEVCVPVAELMGGCGAGVVVVALEQLGEQLGVDGTDAAIKPDGLDLVVAMAWVGWVEFGHPGVEGCLGLGRVAVP